MMNDAPFKYPALYSAADTAAARYQTYYFSLIFLEYALLITAALLAMNFIAGPATSALYAIVFVLLLIILAYKGSAKPEQSWYRGRALAESLKTSSWRYCMRAEPYHVAGDKEAKELFRSTLLRNLMVSRTIANQFAACGAGGEQLGEDMINLRNASLAERKAIYLRHRIKDQKDWYTRKSLWNKNKGNAWLLICGAIYGTALLLVIFRVYAPTWNNLPFEPVIVLASSALGWMQIKKFNELASTYALTAHEIGILENRIGDANENAEFSDFVNEAELAFSREHTQWVARLESI